MIRSAILAFAIAASAPALAAPADFHHGPVIPAFGKVATVKSDMPLPGDATWKHAFDVVDGTAATLNEGIESAARFVNMMGENGVRGDRLKVAVVLHGPAVFDFTNAARYKAKYPSAANPNGALVRALLDAGVQIWVCGQSAAAQDVTNADLQPDVKMALSAITAHAELQRQGYSLNPF